MATLSIGEVGRLAAAAGWTEMDALKRAIAYGMAASGGRTDGVAIVPSIVNAEWDSRIGVWQIRSKKADAGKGTNRDRAALADPAFNAKAIFAITNGGRDWGELSDPSVTARARLLEFWPSTAAAARLALGRGDAGDEALAGGAAIAGGADSAAIPNVIAEIAKDPLTVLRWLQQPRTWTRIAYGAIGITMAVVGVAVVIVKTGVPLPAPVRAVAKGAKK